jgi:hypothetical protein
MTVHCVVRGHGVNHVGRYVVECSTGDKVVFDDEREATYFASTVERCVRGKWQLRVLVRLWDDGEVPADVRRMLRGRAAAYAPKYQEQLDGMMQRLGAMYLPGPRGGRWSGKYVWRWYDAMEARQALVRVLRQLLCEQRREVG